MKRSILLTLTIGATLVSGLHAIMPVSTDGAVVNGTLEASDIEPIPEGPSRSSYEYYRDVYAFDAEADSTIDVNLSCDFDGYLILFDGAGNLLDENDDAGSFAASRITSSLASGGSHYVVVTSFNTGVTGDYALSVENLGVGASEEVALANGGIAAPPIEGTVIEDALTATDNAPIPPHIRRSDATHYRDVHMNPGHAGDMISIDLESDFDGFLMLIDPNGQVVATNDDFINTRTSRIEHAFLPLDGDYMVVVTSYGSHATGSYTLTIGDPMPPPPDTPVEVGQTIEGQIESGDAAAVPTDTAISGTGHGRDGFVYQSPGSEVVDFDLTCRFDAHLVLIGPRGNIVAQTERPTPGGCHISATLFEPGEYRLVVGALSERVMGRYSLTLSPGPPVSPDRPIAEGETIDAVLRPEARAALPDSTRGSGFFFRDGHCFDAEAGDEVTIDLSCPNFDGYLYLIDPGGQIVAFNDDHRGTSASRIQTTLEKAGRYRIVVTTYAAGQNGEYWLTFNRGLIVTQPPAGVTQYISGDAAISFNQPVAGYLSVGDAAVLPDPSRGGNDFYRDGFSFDSIAGTRVMIDLQCPAWDGYLFLVAPSGEIIASNDDFQSNRAAQIVAALTQSGTHRVVVTSFGAYAGGEYTVTLTGLGGPPTTQEPIVEETPDTMVQIGAEIAGSLSAADQAALNIALRNSSAHYRDGYSFHVDANTALEITLLCPAFDGYLYLFGPDGELVGENDDWESTGASRISAEATQTGNHRVVVTSYQSRSEGDYTLTISEASPEE